MSDIRYRHRLKGASVSMRLKRRLSYDSLQHSVLINRVFLVSLYYTRLSRPTVFRAVCLSVCLSVSRSVCQSVSRNNLLFEFLGLLGTEERQPDHCDKLIINDGEPLTATWVSHCTWL